MATVAELKSLKPKTKITVSTTTGKRSRRRPLLPRAFSAPYRPDLIRKAVLFMQTSRFQPKGASKYSGHKYSVESWGAGYGVARVSRVKGRGTRKSMSGGFIPFAVGGRPTHPPKSEKVIRKRLNRKERKLALLSAAAMTNSTEAVVGRGHRLGKKASLPLVVVDKIQSLSKTIEVEKLLASLGLGEELARCKVKFTRAGKGKMRGRRYRRPVGPLIVIEDDKGITDAASNIPGVDVVKLRNLCVEHLAPGGDAGRLVVWSLSAIEGLDDRLLGSPE